MPRVRVRIIEASNLLGADLNGKSDPYVIVMIGNTGVYSSQEKTRHIPRNLNPRWDQAFEMNTNNPAFETLFIQVKDHDDIGKDDSLGECQVPLNDLVRGLEKELWLQLQGGSTGSNLMSNIGGLFKPKTATPAKVTNHGKVHIGITALDFGLPPGGMGAPAPGGWGAPPPGHPAPGGWGAPPPAQGGWGAPPPAQGGWGAPPPGGPGGYPPPGQPAPGGWGAPPPAQGGWGAPPPQQPAPGGWGAPPPGGPGGYPPPGQPAPGGWGAPPPAQGGWGAPPPQQPAPGGWGAPPPAQGGWGAPPPQQQGGYNPMNAMSFIPGGGAPAGQMPGVWPGAAPPPQQGGPGIQMGIMGQPPPGY